MVGKIEAEGIIRGVLLDMKIFFPCWIGIVLKVGLVWFFLQLVVYRIFFGRSLEKFLSFFSMGSLEGVLFGGEDEGSLFFRSVFLVFLVVGGFFVNSSVGSAWLMYGRRGVEKKRWPLWSGESFLFLWLWIRFYVTVLVVSLLISFLLFLCMSFVVGGIAMVLGGGSGDALTVFSLWTRFLFGLNVVLFFVVYCYVSMRFSLVFANFSQGGSVTFTESWRALEGYFLPLAGIGFFVSIVPILVSFLLMFVLSFVVLRLGFSGGMVSVGVGLVSFFLGLLVSMVSMMMLMSAAERLDEVSRRS